MKINGITIRRTYLETPIMDERKWEKIPAIPADVVFGDIEDSCAPNLKEQARYKVVELIKDPTFLGGRELTCRPNNLSTPWGREDLEALAEAKAQYILYPKVRSLEEIYEVKRIFDRRGAAPEIMLIIETPQAVLNLKEIAACPGVTGLMFGPGDLSMETGTALVRGRHAFMEGFLYSRTKTLTTARAYGLEAVEGLFLADLKDLEAVRQAAELSRLFGFTGMGMFYPPHVPIVNEVMTPTAEDVRWARRLIEAYEEARERGLAAVTVDGRWVTVHQYIGAQRTLKVAEALGMA